MGAGAVYDKRRKYEKYNDDGFFAVEKNVFM